MEVKCFNYAEIYYYFYIIYGPIGIGAREFMPSLSGGQKGRPFLTPGAFALDNGTLAHTRCKKYST